MSVLIYYAPMVGLLVWAAVVDARSRRVPNWITFSLLLSGLSISAFATRHISPTQALLGIALGFAASIMLYAVGALGAGDVKLLAGVGAWIGPVPVLLVFACAALVGMVVAIVKAVQQNRVREVLKASMSVGVAIVGGGTGIVSPVTLPSDPNFRQRTLPFAAAIATAAIAFIGLRALQGGSHS